MSRVSPAASRSPQKDSSGNTATGYRARCSSVAQTRRPSCCHYTFTAADAGTHVFSGNVTLKTAGTQSVSATDTVTGTITGVQAGIVVTPATVKTLVVSGIPSPTVAAVAGNVTVTATDAYGNRVSSYLGTIHFASSDPAAVLPRTTPSPPLTPAPTSSAGTSSSRLRGRSP